jgi:signal peptidase II
MLHYPGRFWLFTTLLLSTIGGDQLSKYVARRVLESSGPTPFLKGTVTFSLVENRLGFLGIVGDLPVALQFFFLNICVTLLLLGCLIYLFRSSRRNSSYGLPLVLVTGGGLSNLLDRLTGDGGVTDFVFITVGNLQTGIFNLADVFILLGSCVLGFQLFRRPADPDQRPTADD